MLGSPIFGNPTLSGSSEAFPDRADCIGIAIVCNACASAEAGVSLVGAFIPYTIITYVM